MLQIGAAQLQQIGVSFITNWDSYYKLGQALLQSGAPITNVGKIYNKLSQVLQITAIISKQSIAPIKIIGKTVL